MRWQHLPRPLRARNTLQPSASDRMRLRLGLSLIGLALCLQTAAACLLVMHVRAGWAWLQSGGIYLSGKILFYGGLFLIGPSAVRRYPWLRPTTWFKLHRAPIHSNRKPLVSAFSHKRGFYGKQSD